MTQNSEIRTVNLVNSSTGGDYTQVKKPRRNTRKSGGSNEQVKDVSQNILFVKGVEEHSVASNAGSVNSGKWLSGPPAPQLMPPGAPQQSVLSNPLPQQSGGSDNKLIKVELKKTATPKRVHLNPKKHNAPKTALIKKDKTKKVRKVTLGVSSLHKRITRAKKLKEKVKQVPIQQLREQLIKKGLIKSTSKAPESVLRQIATDSQIVAGKAL